MESYSARHLDPDQARAYRSKFDKSWLRRLSHRRERALILRAYRQALRNAPPQPRVLDYPCGAGRFSPAFAAPAGRITIADHSPAMIELARESLAQAGIPAERIATSVGDARELESPVHELESGSFDVACCIRLVHHFREQDDRARILRGLRRVSRGPLVLTWLAADTPKQWMHELRCQMLRKDNRRAVMTHEELVREALDAGYLVERTWSLSGWFSGQSVALLRPFRLP